MKKPTERKNSIFIVFAIILILISISSDNTVLLKIIVPIFIIILITNMIKSALKSTEIVKSIVEDSKYPKTKIPNLTSQENIVNIGHLKIKYGNVLSGIYKDYKIKITTNDYGTYGTHEFPHLTIAEIDVGEIELPYIYLKSKGSISVLNYKRFTNGEKEVRIKFGNELDKNLKLLCTQDYEVEVLQIFTVDFLEFLLDNAKGFTIEFTENKIMFYNAKHIEDKDDLEIIYNTIEKLLYKIEPLMKRLYDDIEAMNNSYRR